MNNNISNYPIITVLCRFINMDIEIIIPTKGIIQVWIIFTDGTRVIANPANSHMNVAINYFAAKFITEISRLPVDFYRLIEVL